MDGYQALGRLIHEHFDLVITGRLIATLDAESLVGGLRAMKVENRNIPCIVMTSDLSSNDSMYGLPGVQFVEKSRNFRVDLENLLCAKIGPEKKPVEAADVPEDGFPFKRVLHIDDRKEMHYLVRMGLGRKGPVIFMTAIERERELERLRALPVEGIIRKPFPPTELKKLILHTLAETMQKRKSRKAA